MNALLFYFLTFSLISNFSNQTIQIEFEYEKGSWLEYEVYAFDGKSSYHYERSARGIMEKKFIFDTEKRSAITYQSSYFSRMKKEVDRYSFEKDTQILKYELEIFKSDKKIIKAYDCYKVVIHDKRANTTINAYVTDAFKDIPIRHFLNKRFPKLKGFPLEINAPRRTGKAFRIIEKIDSKELLNKEFEKDYEEINKKNANRLIQDLTGKSLDHLIESVENEIIKQQQARMKKNSIKE